MDQKSAFDILPHSIFREKLSVYNFDESSICWIMSYLSGRTQVVQIENKTSSAIECGNLGTPQGSVLSLLFHILNCNDFPDCHFENEEVEGILFVDDNSDNAHAKSRQELQDMLQSEVNNSVSWLSDNKLCIAPDKSKLLVLGNQKLKESKLNDDIKITINGLEICES